MTRDLEGFDPTATADWIESAQLENGCIPHFAGAVADPWNHVEAAMGLDAAGRHSAAELAYEWLLSVQRSDGAWASAYDSKGVVDPTLDANFTAYAAAGIWHHYVATGDVDSLERTWRSVERAIEFVLALQVPGGSILWARDERYRAWPEPLLTSCACIYLSLRSAVAIAETLGEERPDWELALTSLGDSITDPATAFADKSRFSMDWYYPILAGAVTGHAARRLLWERWDTFVVEGLGCRCVSDAPWITSGETSELILALDVAGLHDHARAMFGWLQHLRDDNGGYWIGANFPGRVVWPQQQPTWAAGSVLLAADALAGEGPASGFFRGETFREAIDVPDPL